MNYILILTLLFCSYASASDFTYITTLTPDNFKDKGFDIEVTDKCATIRIPKKIGDCKIEGALLIKVDATDKSKDFFTTLIGDLENEELKNDTIRVNWCSSKETFKDYKMRIDFNCNRVYIDDFTQFYKTMPNNP